MAQKNLRESYDGKEEQVGQRKENPGPGRMKIQQIGKPVPNEIGLKLGCGNTLGGVKEERHSDRAEGWKKASVSAPRLPPRWDRVAQNSFLCA